MRKKVNVNMTPEQREIVLEEASKLGVSASRYMSIFSNDDCVVKKKVIAPYALT